MRRRYDPAYHKTGRGSQERDFFPLFSKFEKRVVYPYSEIPSKIHGPLHSIQVGVRGTRQYLRLVGGYIRHEPRGGLLQRNLIFFCNKIQTQDNSETRRE